MGGSLTADGAEDRAESCSCHSDATQHISDRERDAFGRKCDHEHAESVKDAAGCDRSRCTKPVRDVADERRKRAHEQQRQGIGKRPELASNVEVGCNWLLEDAEALPRTDPDREDQGSADYRDPEAAFLRLGGCFT